MEDLLIVSAIPALTVLIPIFGIILIGLIRERRYHRRLLNEYARTTELRIISGGSRRP